MQDDVTATECRAWVAYANPHLC